LFPCVFFDSLALSIGKINKNYAYFLCKTS